MALLIGLGAIAFGQPLLGPAPPGLVFSTTTLTNGLYGSSYKSQTLKVTGGKSPYSFSSGTGLPPGMTLSTDGVLSGTPAAAGNFSFTVTVQDHSKNTLTGTQKYAFVIDQAPLTVAVNNAAMTYGGAVPALTISYHGFVNGDNASSLTVPPALPTGASSSSPAGAYPITASGAADPNYAITYQTGTLTVGKAALTVAADNKSMPFGGPLPSLTLSYAGFVNGDNAASLTMPPIASTTATAASPAGTYPIIPKGGVSSNYLFNYVNGILAIAKANPVLTISANPAGSIYGAPLVPGASLTVSYSGFVNGDGPGSLTVLPTVTNTASSGAPAGSYTLIPSGAVIPNYIIQYVDGSYTIGQAALNVTANAQTKEFGSPDPALTYTVSGLLNGDNTGVVTGSLVRTPGEKVGSYPISKGSLSAGSNYTIGYSGNMLTITKASQQITWKQSLLVGCNSASQVHLTATASSGLPVTYSVSDANIASISGNLLTLVHPGTAVVTASQAGDADHGPAAAVTDTVFYQPASLIDQHWGDVLFFDNSSGDFVQWQWYKNGDSVSGATSPYYSELPTLNGQYYVIATNRGGQVIQSCTLNITGGATIPGGIKVYPNPAKAGAMATVTSNYSRNSFQGAILQLLDINGKVRQQLTNVEPSMQMAMPSQTGLYVISLLLANGQKASINVLVVD